MKKKILIVITILFPFFSFATSRTWNGSVNNSWNVANNWSPAGVPVAGSDDITFDGGITPIVTITDVAAFTNAQFFGLFSAINNVTVNLSSASPTHLLFSTMILISTGSRVNIGASTTTLFVFGGNSVNPFSTAIDGTLDLQGTGLANQKSYYVYNGVTTNAVAKINGKIILSGTSATIVNANNTNLSFESASFLDITRDGGNVPEANFKNGSTITISGVVNNLTTLNSTAIFNGLLIWNCGSQTISGSSAILLPTANAVMDSLRITSTGSGSLRLFTEPNGYLLGHVEVQGGILQMSAPLIGNKTGSITTDLKISGGTVIGNASFVGEGLVGFAMTLSVGGQFIMTGGTLDLTDRPVGIGAAGAFQLNVAGNVSQTAGTITATSFFGSQNLIALNGSTAQNLTMSTFSGPMALVISNTSTPGITLLSNLTIPASPAALVFNTGVLHTSSTNLLTMAAGSSVFGASDASFVDGPVRKIGNTAFTFPVGDINGPFTGYVPIEVSATVGPATDNFTAEYRHSAAGIYPVTNPGINHVSLVDYWILDRSGSTSNVDVTTYWTALSSSNGSPSYINDLTKLIIASSNGTSWNNFGGLSTYGASTVTAGSLTWSGLTTSFGPFSLASTTINNPLPVELNYLNGFKQNGSHLLNWKVTCNNNAEATMVLERSADKQNFTAITTVNATALRCQQPFDYTDIAPLAGINYYRLKMVDANGKITYSAIIALLNKSTGFEIVNLLPTVVNNNAILNITAAQKIKMDIVITDITGRQVQKIAYNLIAGSNQFNLNLAGLGAGTYQITGYTADEKSKTIRFVKQ